MAALVMLRLDHSVSDVVPREIMRSRRKRAIRSRSISVKRLTKWELEQGRKEFPPDEFENVSRPVIRGDCANVPRPCPFVSCRHNLYLDVSPRTGAIKLNKPDIEPHDMSPDQSCVLDIADRGGATLEEVGEAMNIVRERTRQIEVVALARVRDASGASLEEWRRPDTKSKRRLPVLQVSRMSGLPTMDEPEDEDEEGSGMHDVSREWGVRIHLDDDPADGIRRFNAWADTERQGVPRRYSEREAIARAAELNAGAGPYATIDRPAPYYAAPFAAVARLSKAS